MWVMGNQDVPNVDELWSGCETLGRFNSSNKRSLAITALFVQVLSTKLAATIPYLKSTVCALAAKQPLQAEQGVTPNATHVYRYDLRPQTDKFARFQNSMWCVSQGELSPRAARTGR